MRATKQGQDVRRDRRDNATDVCGTHGGTGRGGASFDGGTHATGRDGDSDGRGGGRDTQRMDPRHGQEGHIWGLWRRDLTGERRDSAGRARTGGTRDGRHTACGVHTRWASGRLTKRRSRFGMRWARVTGPCGNNERVVVRDLDCARSLGESDTAVRKQ